MNAIDQHNSFTVRDEQGFAVYALGSGTMEISVVPELGARIISLKSLRSGREWMWHPPGELKLFRNRPGDDFAMSTLAGMDECLPSIAPCSWAGRKLPDHGEVWSVPWKVEEQAWKSGVLRTSTRLEISPLQFERAVEVQNNDVYLSYQLNNLGTSREHFLWAMHPLLSIQPGDELQLPSSIRSQLNGEGWMDSLDSGLPPGNCAKGFVRPVKEGVAGVFNRVTGDRLEFAWDPAENDTLGLWLTRGGWHGHHHLALEPANGAHDALPVAAASGHCGVVEAGAFVNWRVRIRIGH